MNKTIITKWLESTQADQLDALKASKDAAMTALFEKQAEPFGNLIAAAAHAIRTLTETEDTIIERAEEAGYSFYHSFAHTRGSSLRHDGTTSEYKKFFINAVLDNRSGGSNAELDKLLTKYSNARSTIKENYTALIANVKMCKSAKDAVEYLKSLNIDLTDLQTYAQEALPKSLALPVDLSCMGLKVHTENSKEDK